MDTEYPLLCCAFVIYFLIYFEYNVGSTLIRKDENNITRFLPRSVLYILFSPFYKKDMWHSSLLDVNSIVQFGVFNCLYGCYKIVNALCV